MRLLAQDRAREIHERIEKEINDALSAFVDQPFDQQVATQIHSALAAKLVELETELSMKVGTIREVFHDEEWTVVLEPHVDTDGWGSNAPEAIMTARYLEKMAREQTHRGHQLSARLNEIAAREIRFLMTLVDPERYAEERRKSGLIYKVEKSRA